ncbi:MAG: RsmB/NOP family class I SAM-dependent RNA methyltransferase [Pseudomonadota bacterium]
MAPAPPAKRRKSKAARDGGKANGTDKPHGQKHPVQKPGLKKPGLSVRTEAATRLYQLLQHGKPLPDTDDWSGDHRADAGLLKALTLTTLRNLAGLDAALAACLERPLKTKAARASAILRVMAAQILVMDMEEHAAVSLATEDAGRHNDTRALKGLINAVGRRMAREKVSLSKLVDAALPEDWLTERWTRIYGTENARQINLAARKTPALDLTLKPSVDGKNAMERFTPFEPLALAQTTIRLCEPASVRELPGYVEGHWWVQDAASALPAKLLLDHLNCHEKAHVLDMCAAPGGKTAQLAAAGCQVTALDQSKPRMDVLVSNMTRLGLDVATHVGDALAYAPKEPFDAVLLDAPCSATGTIRRHPEVRHLRSEGDIAALSKIQANLLDHAASLLAPGGILAYVICSLEPEEGEDQIAAFLDRQSGWEIIPIKASQAPANAVSNTGTLRTRPDQSMDETQGDEARGMDGFYCALLRYGKA